MRCILTIAIKTNRNLKIKYVNQDRVNQERLYCLVTPKSFRKLLLDHHLSRQLLCQSHHNNVGDNALNLNKCMMRCSYNSCNYQIIRNKFFYAFMY